MTILETMIVARCDVTGNACGTDAVAEGATCPSGGKCRYLSWRTIFPFGIARAAPDVTRDGG